MARKVSFVPTAVASGLVPMDRIPDDVKQEAEDIYNTLRESDGRFSIAFDTKEELEMYSRQIASYCTQRTAKQGGPLKFRRSPTKNRPENVLDFRITADQSEQAAAARNSQR